MRKFKTAVAIVTVALWSSLCLIGSPESQAQLSGAGPEPVPVPGLARHLDVESFEAEFRATHLNTGIGTWKGVSSIYGRAFSHGATAVESAENFRLNVMPMFGIAAEELQPSFHIDGAADFNIHTLPLMYNRDTNSYKFTAAYYRQQRGGLDVFGTRLTLLTRNEPNHPLVLANVHLRDLGNFQVNQAAAARFNPAQSFANATAVLGANAQILSQPRAVIWAGIDEMAVQPALALEFTGNGGDPMMGNYQEIRFITDITTGAILHQESLIHEVDVTGNVSGMTTTGHGADICGGIAAADMPYVKVAIGATEVFADANGNFTIPNGGASDVSVTAHLSGQYFDLKACNGTSQPSPQGAACPNPAPTLSQNVTPPGPANFMFNNGNLDALRRAEVNAYLHANVIRDYVLSYNPAYPVIAAETGFDVNVNLNNTCNAFYSSSFQSINFYISGGACSNTANSTVVHHEYGHRLVNAAGSGQGQYGEGMSDCMAVIVTNQSCLGDGFNLPCGPPGGCLRNADNDCQYSAASCTSNCGGPNHPCGRLISGCVWDTRLNLQVTNPFNYRDIISELVINSVPLHTGTGITPQITIDFLTLDDNDADISNGSPHYHQINNAFTDHNMPGPVLNGFSIDAVPTSDSVCAPDEAQYTITIGPVASTSGPVNLVVNGVPAGANAMFSVNPVEIGNSTVLTISNTAGAASGNYVLTVVGTQGPYQHEADLDLGISNGQPGVATLSSPTNGETGVSLAPTLMWSAAPNALSYLVQVATDAGFTNIVHSAMVNTNSHTVTPPLNTVSTYRWRVQSHNGCGISAFSSTFSFTTANIPPILLVDDDDNSPNVRTYYTNALDSLGLTYDVWDTGNTAQTEPALADISPYRIIIWFSGDTFAGTTNPKAGPKAVTETALSQWMDGGGCLMLSSQDYLWDRIGSGSTTPNSFMQNYLGMGAPIDHDVGMTSVFAGQNVFSGLGPYTLAYSSGSGGPGMSNYSDEVPAATGAMLAFTYSGGGSAVTRDGVVFRAMFWGFPFEAINDSVARALAMDRFINWCAELFPPPACMADVSNDGNVGTPDLLLVINQWGPCVDCAADIAPPGGDDNVGVPDLLEVINAWGDCP